MKKLVYLLVVFLMSQIATAQTSFITTWRTDNSGTSNSTSITIPTSSGLYNYDVDWNNDGTFDDLGVTGNITHNYGAAGTYTIAIKGSFPAIYFYNGGYASDASKLLSINQWGSNVWGSMRYAFFGCNNLVINATDKPDLSSCDLTGMFSGCSSLNQDISTWDVSHTVNMSFMFSGCSSFNQPIGSWNVSNVTDMSGMFQSATAFNQPIGGWNVSNVIDMNNMFALANAFNQDISGWHVSNVTNMEDMFGGATSFNQDISSWNVISVTNMSNMFAGALSFNQNIDGWAVDNVTNMIAMFNNAFAFNQSLNSWRTDNVTNMQRMFYNATTFNGNIDGWNVSNVTDMSYMFANAPFNKNIGGWTVGKVTDMSWMFLQNYFFNQNIGGWNVSKVTNMNYMFSGAVNFNQDIHTWDISKVTSMISMFTNCYYFNQDISSWNISNVTDMSGMFNNAPAFNQNIGAWNITNATITNIFTNSGISSANYDAILIAWNNAGYTNKDLGDAYPLKYCAGQAARSNMLTNKGWAITGDVSLGPAIGTSTDGGVLCKVGDTKNVYNSNMSGGGVWSSNNTGIATVSTSQGGTGTITAVANGTAIITYTKTANGCSSSASTTVIVAIVPKPAAITGVNNVCVGATTSSNVANATTGGVWGSTGRVNVSIGGAVTGINAGATTITYTVTNANGCSNAATPYPFTVNPLPAMPSIAYAPGTTGVTGSGGVCRNKIFTLVGTPSGGTWASLGAFSITNLGVVTSSATAGSGSVTYTYTNSNGCSNFRTTSSNVLATCKGINNAQLAISNEQLVIYPNPTHSKVNLKIKNLIGAGSIVITDLYGKQLKQQTLSMGTNTVDVSSFAKGMYLVSVITDTGKQTQKVVVE